jgi:hypothetical protein
MERNKLCSYTERDIRVRWRRKRSSLSAWRETIKLINSICQRLRWGQRWWNKAFMVNFQLSHIRILSRLLRRSLEGETVASRRKVLHFKVRTSCRLVSINQNRQIWTSRLALRVGIHPSAAYWLLHLASNIPMETPSKTNSLTTNIRQQNQMTTHGWGNSKMQTMKENKSA